MKHLKALPIVFVLFISTKAFSQGVVWSCFDVTALEGVVVEQANKTKQRIRNKIEADTIANLQAGLSDVAKNQVDQKIRSQEFNRYLRSFVEPSTVTSMATWTTNLTDYQKRNYVLDADVQTPISIGWKLNSIQIIPRFVVRIFNNDSNVPMNPDRSLPVRTPSYIPGITYYRTIKKFWMNPDNPVNGNRQDYYLGAFIFHHSNGQDGPEFYTSDPTRVNVYNGNFGENVVFELMVGGRTRWQSLWTDEQLRKFVSTRSDRSDGQELRVKTGRSRQASWRVGYEEHPRPLTNGEFLKYAMYGRHRMNLTGIMSWLPTEWRLIRSKDQWCTLVPDSEYERWRLTFHVTYILDGVYRRGNLDNLKDIGFFNAGKRLNASATLYWVIPTTDFTALFVRGGYSGSDPYNIYFNQSLWEFKFGLAFGFFEQPDARLRN